MALSKVKWVLHFEKSVEINIEVGPNAALGCHPESWGLILVPHTSNATLRILRTWPKIGQKVTRWKKSKDKSAQIGLFPVTPLSHYTAKFFLGQVFTGFFSGRLKNRALVRASGAYYSGTA